MKIINHEDNKKNENEIIMKMVMMMMILMMVQYKPMMINRMTDSKFFWLLKIQNEVRIPATQGIAGHVATTGKLAFWQHPAEFWWALDESEIVRCIDNGQILADGG